MFVFIRFLPSLILSILLSNLCFHFFVFPELLFLSFFFFSFFLLIDYFCFSFTELDFLLLLLSSMYSFFLSFFLSFQIFRYSNLSLSPINLFFTFLSQFDFLSSSYSVFFLHFLHLTLHQCPWEKLWSISSSFSCESLRKASLITCHITSKCYSIIKRKP